MKLFNHKKFIKIYLLFVLIASSLITYVNKNEILFGNSQLDQVLSSSSYPENKQAPNCKKYYSNVNTQINTNFRKDIPNSEDLEENVGDEISKQSPPSSKQETKESLTTETEGETTEKEPAEEQTPPGPSPNSCPQVTLGCVPCEPGEAYCRYVQGESSGYLGWACQNNNPSNIRSDPSNFRAGLITQMGGPAPCGDKGGYLVFKTYTDGFNGVKAYIRAINSGLHYAYKTSEFTCGDCTLLQFFSKYAPNNPEGYTNGIVTKMQGSVTSETKLSWIVDNRLDDFVEAIQCMEGYFTLGGRLCKFW